MRLFTKEEPYKTITLSELYPEQAEAGEIETDVEFAIFHSGQRTFRKHWFRVARKGNLPQAMVGQGTEEDAGRDFIAMLATDIGFDAGFDLVAHGVISDVRNFPSTNGDGEMHIVGALSELPAGERDAELRALLEGASDLLIQLLMAALNAGAEYTKEITDRSGKSSASSNAQRAEPTPKSEG